MEWLPKLYDTLDSVAFELRMRWAGYGGQQLRMLAMLVSLVAISSISPAFRNVVLAAMASFMLAEMLSTAAPEQYRAATS